MAAKCGVCGKVLPDQAALERHKEQHRVKCDVCRKSLYSVVQLRYHMRDIHSLEVQCNVCKYPFADEAARKLHELQNDRCDICKKPYACIGKLRRHMRLVHSVTAGDETSNENEVSLPFSCDYCKNLFSSTIILNRHIRNRHRVQDGASASVKEEHPDAALSDTKFKEKPLTLCSSHGVPSKDSKPVEATVIGKSDVTSESDSRGDCKPPVSELTAAVPADQGESVQNINSSFVSYVSLKLEPEDFKEPTNVGADQEVNVVEQKESLARESATHAEKESARDVEEESARDAEVESASDAEEESASDAEEESAREVEEELDEDAKEGSAIHGPVVTPNDEGPTDAIHARRLRKEPRPQNRDAIAVDDKRKYLPIQKQLHPFPKNGNEWKDLWDKFSVSCPYCSSKLSCSVTWRAHVERHMANSRNEKAQVFVHLWDKYKPSCLHCIQEFSLQSDWKNHMETSHGISVSPAKEFEALFKATFGLSNLDDEGDFESGSDAESFWSVLWTNHGPNCQLCHSEYNPDRKRNWMNHMLVHHTSNRQTCTKCNAAFKCRHFLKSHEQYMHSEKSETCTLLCLRAKCGMSFTSRNKTSARALMGKHIRTKHPDPTAPRDFVCQACGIGFVYKSQLKAHSLKHTKGRPFMCEYCPKSYKEKHHLQKHVKIIHKGCRPKVVKSKLCSDCGGLFTPHRYIIHVLSHTGEKPVKCSQCDGAFKSKSAVAAHMVFHQGKREYLCDICKSSFFLKHHLTAHMKAHSDEKPFHCDICSSDFRLKHHLQAHRSRRHGIQSGTTRGPKAKVIAGLESKPRTDSCK